ncbi:hypothetical protein ACVW1C_005954 [Bradyrhizobium sp. USDA 4011]
MGKTLRIASTILAGENALEEAAKADCGRSGEQNGAHRLGLDGSRWRLPSSSVWRGVTQSQTPGDVGNVVKSNGGYGQSVRDRDWKNQKVDECQRARVAELDPIHVFHKGPRRVEVASRGRTHVSTRPHACSKVIFCLHLLGVHTHPLAERRKSPSIVRRSPPCRGRRQPPAPRARPMAGHPWHARRNGRLRVRCRPGWLNAATFCRLSAPLHKLICHSLTFARSSNR